MYFAIFNYDLCSYCAIMKSINQNVRRLTLMVSPNRSWHASIHTVFGYVLL